jgi:hypothetical protein
VSSPVGRTSTQDTQAENEDPRAVKTAQIAKSDEEQAWVVRQLRTEAASLKEKWHLLGRVTELEQLQKLQQAAPSERGPSAYAVSVCCSDAQIAVELRRG